MRTYYKTWVTSDSAAFEDGGKVIMLVVTGDGTNNGLVTFKDADGGNTLFTVRVGAHETRVVRFGPDNAYPVAADEDFYVDVTTVDGVLILYEA